MFSPSNIIKEYRVTEKATDLMANDNKYTFSVYKTATRTQVAAAISKLYSVEVERVNIINQSGKAKRNRVSRGAPGRTVAIKKAIVTLKEGSKIELA